MASRGRDMQLGFEDVSTCSGGRGWPVGGDRFLKM